MSDFSYKLGSTYGQNTPKLTIAPSFFTITDPNLGPVSLPVTPIQVHAPQNIGTFSKCLAAQNYHHILVIDLNTQRKNRNKYFLVQKISVKVLELYTIIHQNKHTFEARPTKYRCKNL